MSTVVVPDDIIHHILNYAEVLDIIRARSTARRVQRVIDTSYELAIRLRLFSLGLPISFRYTSGLHSMDLHNQLGRLEQIAGAWQRLRPTTRIRLRDFDFMQYFDPQGNTQDLGVFSLVRILRYRPPRLISRKMVIRERWSETQVNGNLVIDALEVVRLPIGSQGAADEADLLLNGSLNGEPRTVMSLGCHAFGTAVSPSERLLALLTPAGTRILLQNFPWNIKHPDALHDRLALGEEYNLSQAVIIACGDYLLFRGSEPNPEAPAIIAEQTLKLWNWKSGELLLDGSAVDSIFLEGNALLALRRDPESLHYYLKIYLLPGLTNNRDVRFYLPRLRSEGTYVRMSFSKPSLDDDQPKSLVAIHGNVSFGRPFGQDRHETRHPPHCIFTAVAVHSLVSLHGQLQYEQSTHRRAMMWREWAPGRARFIIYHGRLDDGAQTVGMKAICRLSPPPYELGFPNEAKNMHRRNELYLVVLDFNQYERNYAEKYLSRLRPRIPLSVAEGPDAKPQNNAYPGFLAAEEDRCSYMLRQYFSIEDSRGPPIKQLELRSYVSLTSLMHRNAQDGKARTQWTAWEDGFLEWSPMELDVWNF